SGRVGDVLTLRSTRAFTLDGVWLRDGWRRGGGESAGLLLDQGTHHTSLLRYLGGPIAWVTAQASTPAPKASIPSLSSAPPATSASQATSVTRASDDRIDTFLLTVGFVS